MLPFNADPELRYFTDQFSRIENDRPSLELSRIISFLRSCLISMAADD